MLQSGFVWGDGGKKLSASDARRYRELSDAMLARNSTVASNPWEGLAQLTGAFTGTMMGNEANAAESEQREILAQALAGGDYQSVMGSEWASPQQSALASALMGRDWQVSDRDAGWAREDARYAEGEALRNAQLEAALLGNERNAWEFDQARNAPADPFAGTQVINDQLVTFGDQGPQVLGDYRDQPETGFRQLGPEEVAAANLDPNKAWQVGPDNRIHEVGGAGVTVNNNMGDSLSPGWEAIDKAFADTYLSWTGGGSADTRAQLDNLGNALSILGQDGGAETGNLVSALPRDAQAFLNPQGLIARENVEETVQRSLRETLGAQFTEREGERLIQRAFNPLLPTHENVRRVNLLVSKIQEMARAKDAMADYFRQNGTLMGYEGLTPTMSDLASVEQQFGEDPQGDAPASGGSPDGIGEGTVIENDQGQRLVLRNGEWVEMI